eukprot:jgi/Tetstr1/461104/TSEL_006243.t1
MQASARRRGHNPGATLAPPGGAAAGGSFYRDAAKAVQSLRRVSRLHLALLLASLLWVASHVSMVLPGRSWRAKGPGQELVGWEDRGQAHPGISHWFPHDAGHSMLQAGLGNSTVKVGSDEDIMRAAFHISTGDQARFLREQAWGTEHEQRKRDAVAMAKELVSRFGGRDSRGGQSAPEVQPGVYGKKRGQGSTGHDSLRVGPGTLRPRLREAAKLESGKLLRGRGSDAGTPSQQSDSRKGQRVPGGSTDGTTASAGSAGAPPQAGPTAVRQPPRHVAPARFGTARSADGHPHFLQRHVKVPANYSLPIIREREFGKHRPMQDKSAAITQLYASYFGGRGDDRILAAAAADGRGLWIAGEMRSVIRGPRQQGRTADGHRSRMLSGAPRDAFVARIGADGEVVHLTYIGGSGTDSACGISEPGEDGVWVVGSTTSPDLQATAATAAQAAHSGSNDIFVARIDSQGKIRYLTYLGGSGHDSACAISRGADGHVWVGGVTQSTDLPVSDGAQGKTRGGGGSDGLLACIEPNGHLGYLSYVSGQVGSDGITALLATSWQSQWLGGYMSLPGSAGIHALVSRFDVEGRMFTPILRGGGGNDRVTALAEDPWDGTVLALGITTSAEPTQVTFRTKVRAVAKPQPLLRHPDAYVAKLLPNGTLHSVATLQGDRRDVLNAAALSAGGVTLWLAGTTTSTDLEVAAAGSGGDERETGRQQGVLDGKTDGVIAKVSMRSWKGDQALQPDGVKYLGGSGEEDVTALVALADGTVWVVGNTNSDNLKVSMDADMRKHGGGWDGFLMRVS